MSLSLAFLMKYWRNWPKNNNQLAFFSADRMYSLKEFSIYSRKPELQLNGGHDTPSATGGCGGCHQPMQEGSAQLRFRSPFQTLSQDYANSSPEGSLDLNSVNHRLRPRA